MARKKLTQAEMEHLAEQLSDVESLAESCESSDEYQPSSSDNSDLEIRAKLRKTKPGTISDVSESELEEKDISHELPSTTESLILWLDPDENFEPRKEICSKWAPKISSEITEDHTPLQIFQKFFPSSLFLYIAQCTNERLELYENEKEKKKRIQPTSSGEIKIMIGCMFIMTYNHVPSIFQYWSTHPSMGNKAIQKAISRDRFQLIFSKMYFASPKKPDDCSSKTYYIDDVVSCLKEKFIKYRQDSTFQSIDESMTKFKGRSSLKQYMPLKPIKRGIKMWLRCDSYTGYTYDFNIYTGRETEPVTGTLGERVVKTLASTIREKDVTLCFDRFFTSVNLLKTLDFPALGTCISNRKNLPKIDTKLAKGESVFKACKEGLLYTKWQDTKEVYVLSNCHKNTLTTVKKTLKDGSKQDTNCPEMISFYRKIMGGVDLADQMMGVYEMDRKSNKWWKKVFCRLMMMSAVNAWVISNDASQKKKPFLQFLVALAEELIAEGEKNYSLHQPDRNSRISERRKSFGKVSLHLPIEGSTRRRCKRCTENKTQTRTTTLCQECKIPLCKHCFALYHN